MTPYVKVGLSNTPMKMTGATSSKSDSVKIHRPASQAGGLTKATPVSRGYLWEMDLHAEPQVQGAVGQAVRSLRVLNGGKGRDRGGQVPYRWGAEVSDGAVQES